MGATDREYGKAYPIAKAVVKPVVDFLWRINTTGLHHVPVEGPAIFCPNHISFFDSIVLPAVLPRRISYVGKAEYMDSAKTRYIFPAIGMVPIDRSGGSASQRALDTAARILDRGELFGIYPEGTRSRSGYLHRGRTGAARLALRTGAPILPVGIIGTDAIQPAGTSVPRPFKSCQVNIGAPIDVTRYLDRADDHLTLRQITDEVMFEVRTLSGRDYVDTYARSDDDDIPEPSIPGADRETVDVTAAGVAERAEPADARRSSADVLGAMAWDRIAEDRVPVLPDGSVADDDSPLDGRRSSADVLSRWYG